MKRLWNWILDKTIYYSFDKTGYLRHKKLNFKALNERDIGVTLITGGTSGIGEALADMVSKNSKTIVTGRNKQKFKSLPNKSFLNLDSADWISFDKVIQDLPMIENLVFNAGGMPETYKENPSCVELQCASQLVGHLILFNKLHKASKLTPSAKILFTSSGGMLLKKLNLSTLFKNSRYDKVATYANVKRAQVIINEEISKLYPQYQWASMHPGWVATQALKEAIPSFFSKMEKRLRSADEGADTLYFLLLENSIPNGKFWFDRQIVSTHLSPFTKESVKDRKRLVKRVLSYLR